jgi:N-acetyl-anhydromuramyl-L-alanine amidase AmpD
MNPSFGVAWPSNPPPPPPPPVLRQWQSNNYWPGRPYGTPIAIVIHTEAGSEAGTESEFINNSSQVSAHFGVGLDGRDDQFVRLSDSAWANGIFESGNNWLAAGLPYLDPNWLTVAIETEDLGDNTHPVTDAQFGAVLADCRLALAQYPSISWLLRHADISPLTRPQCPGIRWVDSGRFAQLAETLGLQTLI